ncbi:MAG: hypothetical protein KDD70_02500 [Bdellovibrionales bacterium]|nr:hypothetical protein [Bdellovibrionales bacterium]
MMKFKNILVLLGVGALTCTFSGCSQVGDTLNPFAEEPAPEALLGTPNDHLLKDEGSKVGTARSALQEVSRYPKAHQPQPMNPVVQPSVVRLMWVPDHLNKQGDLVPAHFYYLKVLEDRWAVTDVFDQQKLINESNGGDIGGSAIPFTASAQ